ncbi:MAG: Ig-like domain-containing protein, partial [Clostridia bacterium]|nr:Ig-like domain-containing protein [Clostridia bacterium]
DINQKAACAVTAAPNSSFELPAKVTVGLSDSSIAWRPVTWDIPDDDGLSHAAGETIEVYGTIDGTGESVKCTVHFTSAQIVSVRDCTATTPVGCIPNIAALTDATLDDGTTLQLSVNWEKIYKSDVSEEGTFTVKGKVNGYDGTVKCTVTVTPASVVKHQSPTIYVPSGGEVILPSQIEAYLSDGTTELVDVVWEDYSAMVFKKGGTHKISGRVGNYPAVAYVVVTDPNISAAEVEEITCSLSSQLKLPEKVHLLLSDGTKELSDVYWDTSSLAKIDFTTAGEYTVNGIAAMYNYPVSLTVCVVPPNIDVVAIDCAQFGYMGGRTSVAVSGENLQTATVELRDGGRTIYRTRTLGSDRMQSASVPVPANVSAEPKTYTLSVTSDGAQSASEHISEISVSPPVTDSYPFRLLTDEQYAVEVEGFIDENAELIVRPLSSDSDEYAALSEYRATQDVISAFCVILDAGKGICPYTGAVRVTMPLDASYNGRPVTMLHRTSDGYVEAVPVTMLSDGEISARVTELQYFALVDETSGENAVGGREISRGTPTDASPRDADSASAQDSAGSASDNSAEDADTSDDDNTTAASQDSGAVHDTAAPTGGSSSTVSNADVGGSDSASDDGDIASHTYGVSTGDDQLGTIVATAAFVLSALLCVFMSASMNHPAAFTPECRRTAFARAAWDDMAADRAEVILTARAEERLAKRRRCPIIRGAP